MMDVFWICVAGALAVSLTLPRFWLHAVGIVGCMLLAVHAAVDLEDTAFLLLQLACVAANGVGLIRWAAKQGKGERW